MCMSYKQTATKMSSSVFVLLYDKNTFSLFLYVSYFTFHVYCVKTVFFTLVSLIFRYIVFCCECAVTT